MTTNNGVSTCACSPSTPTYDAFANQQLCYANCGLQDCVGCQQNSNNCARCATGYVLIGNSCILTCPVVNCQNCFTPGICQKCSPGLVVSTSGSSCITCNVGNCTSCELNNTCSVCVNGFTLSNGACVSCTIQNCFLCSSPAICDICFGLYKPGTSGNCILCEAPCSTCNPDSTCSACLSPLNPTPLSNGTCYSCQDPHCASCDNTTITCLACKTGYNLGSNNKCSAQCSSTLCAVCSGSNVAQCSICIQGYYANVTTSTCMQCTGAPACIQCFQTSPTICILCANGFFLTSNNTCVNCPSYCSSCTSASSCQALAVTQGQVLLTSNNVTLLASCDVGCFSCSKISPLACAICYPGYNLQPAGFNIPSYCAPCQNNCMRCTI